VSSKSSKSSKSTKSSAPTRGVSPETASRVVFAAGLLWCRQLSLPHVRQIAAYAEVSPSTVVGAFGGTATLIDEVVTRELTGLHRVFAARHDDREWMRALGGRAIVQHQFDPALTRLPALAVGRAAAQGLAVPRLSPAQLLAVHALGALARVDQVSEQAVRKLLEICLVPERVEPRHVSEFADIGACRSGPPPER
jgi:hypothetical protein